MLQGFNEGNWDLVRDCLADDVTYSEKATGLTANTADAWIASSKGWKNAFSNATGTLLSRLEQGDTVVEEIMWAGLHHDRLDLQPWLYLPFENSTGNRPGIPVSIRL